MTRSFFGSSFGLAALIAAAFFGASASTADTAIGKTAAVALAASSQKPGQGAPQALAVGADLSADERLTTDESGRIDALFLDGSSLTLGANSDIVLDRFVFDPAADSGDAAIKLLTGTLRVIGGRISKSQSIEVKTPHATMAIRGGIGIFDIAASGEGIAVMLYGKSLTVTGKDGGATTILRPGFAVRFSPTGAPSAAFRLAPEDLTVLLAKLETQQGRAASGALPPISENEAPTEPATLDLADPETPLLAVDPAQRPREDVNAPNDTGSQANQSPQEAPASQSQDVPAATTSDPSMDLPSTTLMTDDSGTTTLPADAAPLDLPLPTDNANLEPLGPINVDVLMGGAANFTLSVGDSSDLIPVTEALDSLTRDLCANAQPGAVIGTVICP